MKYQFINANSMSFNINLMCMVFDVSRSGYYSWLGRPISNRVKANNALIDEIKRVFYDSKKRYGFRRVYKQLKQEKIACGKNRIARLMKKNSLISKIKRKFKATEEEGKRRAKSSSEPTSPR